MYGHLHKMIEEPVSAGRFFGEKPQLQADAAKRFVPRHPTAFSRYDPCSKRKGRGGNTRLAFIGRSIGPGPIAHKAGRRVGLLLEEQERRTFQVFQQTLIRRGKGHKSIALASHGPRQRKDPSCPKHGHKGREGGQQRK